MRVRMDVPSPVGKTEDEGIRGGVQETVCVHGTVTMLVPGGPSARRRLAGAYGARGT